MADLLHGPMAFALWAQRIAIVLAGLVCATCAGADLLGETLMPSKYHHPEYEQLGYSCRMCNHLSMDRRGRLFLNYGYFTLNYRSEGKVEGWYYPVLAYSSDRGETWSLVPDDFAASPQGRR